MAASDTFTSYTLGLSSPYVRAGGVTPHDVNELSEVTRALYVGGAGNVNLVLADDTAAVVFYGVPAGTVLPVRVKQVMEASTTATYMVALY